MEKPLRIGQRVNVTGQNGTVESIGLRSNVIRMLTGNLTSIPNQQMANTEVENIGRRSYIRRLFNVTITYDTPPEKITRALEILQEILSIPEAPDPEKTNDTKTLAVTAAAENEAEHRTHQMRASPP